MSITPSLIRTALMVGMGPGLVGCALFQSIDDPVFADGAAGTPDSPSVVTDGTTNTTETMIDVGSLDDSQAPDVFAVVPDGQLVADSVPMADAPPMIVCSTGTHQCGSACVANAEKTSCGTSCTPCPSGPHAVDTHCDGMSCALVCDVGYHLCGGACVSNSDTKTCGTSCAACTVPAGGAATCDGTQCGGSCPTNQKLCNGSCVGLTVACNAMCPVGSHNCGGLCLDNASIGSCGALCMACPTPDHGSATCDGKQCGITCATGYKACSGACIPTGGCCSPTDCTPPTGGTPTCAMNVCGYTCASGFKACGSACIPTANCCSNSDCPFANGAGACSGGTCKLLGCSPGFMDCDGFSSTGCETNIGSDVSNCGGCHRACSLSNVQTLSCKGGVCNSTCAPAAHAWGNCSMPPGTAPDDGCETDLSYNQSNCGACGNACGVPPSSGVICQCGSPLTCYCGC